MIMSYNIINSINSNTNKNSIHEHNLINNSPCDKQLPSLQ